MRTPSPSRIPNGAARGTPIAAAPCCITFGSIFDEKKREALSGALEWRPNDALKLVADGLWTKLQDPQIGYNQSYYFPYGVDQNGNGTWSDSSATIKNGVVTGVTSSNFTPEIVNNTINRNVVTSMYGLKGTLDAHRQVLARTSMPIARQPVGPRAAPTPS